MGKMRTVDLRNIQWLSVWMLTELNRSPNHNPDGDPNLNHNPNSSMSEQF